MLAEAFGNLFRITFSPALDVIYRGARPGDSSKRPAGTVVVGRYVYSPLDLPGCGEKVRASARVVRLMIHQYLRVAIAENAQFFDVSSFSLSASIAGQVLHREDTFSVAQSFELQLVFREDDMFLAILAHQSVYNRLHLPEVVQLLGADCTTVPRAGLCFTGPVGEERWRDCQILEVGSSGRALVHAAGASPSQISIPQERVIPKLALPLIKRLLSAKRSGTNVELLLKRLRAPHGTLEAKHLWEACEAIRAKYIAPIFPIQFGLCEVNLDSEPVSLRELESEVIEERFLCVPRAGGASGFDSIHELLRNNRYSQPVDKPVVVFCTRATKKKMSKLVEELNKPSVGVGGFAGMPTNFNMRIAPLPGAEYLAEQPEKYMEIAHKGGMSPDAEKRSALALVALSEDDETFAHPVPLYFRLKGLFAHFGRPSQVVDPKTVDNKYAYWNLALNLAAKLGQVPWTLEEPALLAPVELFLGFSYSLIRPKELGQRRNIAYVNVFGADGTWKLFYSDDDVFSFEERLRRFPRLAASAVQSATDDAGKLNVVEVHYSKRFGRRERQAIAEGIRSVAPRASIIFVSVSQAHPVRFFNPTNEQVSCPRGTILKLDEETAYVQTVKADKWPGAGHPRPLRVHVYRDYCTLQEDCFTVSKRILGLTRLNWRSIREYSSLPVTILYASLVARLTNYFSFLEWKQIDHDLKRTPWFL